MSNESTGTDKPKKKIHRKPLWLVTPAGQRTVHSPGGESRVEPLFTVEQFKSLVDLRTTLEARELDQTNAKGIFVLRTDPVPVETKMKTQVVIKFGREDEDDAAQDGEEGLV